MNKHRSFVLVFLVLASFALFQPAVAQKKVYSKGIAQKNTSISFLELKIIETDPILKLAKESVPFDRSFFIKIKRLSSSKKPVGTLTIQRDKTDLDPITQEKITTSRQVKDQIPGLTAASRSSIIGELSLIGNASGDVAKINSAVHSIAQPQGKVYEEDENSEFIFIEIQNLSPDLSYTLKIKWDSDSVNTYENYSFTTVASTLDKRLKQRIQPQVGVAVPLFKNGDKTFIKPSLMVGFYYHPRPIDPDIPFKAYKLTALQRFSFLYGLTITSLSEDNVRDNILGSSNIVLGIGYQPADAIRLSYGQLIFYEVSPNKLLSDRKTIANTSYVSLTIDLKLRELLGGIITTLGFK